jgi:hypothetical protein
VSTAVAIPAESVVEIPHLQLVTEPGNDKSEENRWMLAFGLPCLFAGLFVATAIGTGHMWIWGLALASLLTAICMLSWVAISSDTNS